MNKDLLNNIMTAEYFRNPTGDICETIPTGIIDLLTNELRNEIDKEILIRMRFANLIDKLAELGFEYKVTGESSISWSYKATPEINAWITYIKRGEQDYGYIKSRVNNPHGWDELDIGDYFGPITDAYIVQVAQNKIIPMVKEQLKKAEQEKIKND